MGLPLNRHGITLLQWESRGKSTWDLHGVSMGLQCFHGISVGLSWKTIMEISWDFHGEVPWRNIYAICMKVSQRYAYPIAKLNNARPCSNRARTHDQKVRKLGPIYCIILSGEISRSGGHIIGVLAIRQCACGMPRASTLITQKHNSPKEENHGN